MQYFGITENGLESFFEVTKLIFGLPQENDISNFQEPWRVESCFFIRATRRV